MTTSQIDLLSIQQKRSKRDAFLILIPFIQITYSALSNIYHIESYGYERFFEKS
nr:MAG TPA: hypothetical protein [Myoviridae sp. ctQ2H14]